MRFSRAAVIAMPLLRMSRLKRTWSVVHLSSVLVGRPAVKTTTAEANYAVDRTRLLLDYGRASYRECRACERKTLAQIEGR